MMDPEFNFEEATTDVLGQVVLDAERGQPTIINKDGNPGAVVVGWSDYQDMVHTLDHLAAA